MNEAKPPPIPYVAERPRRPRWMRWLFWMSLVFLALLVVGFIWHLQSGSRELQKAYALADAQDPLWRMSDFNKRVPQLLADQDAALVVRESAATLPKPWPGLPLGEINMVLRGQDPRVTVSTMAEKASPGNRRLHPLWLEQLAKARQGTALCRQKGKPLANLTQGSFGVVSDMRKQFFAPDYEAVIQVGEAFRQEALLEGIEGKPSSWEQLWLALHIDMLPDEPSISNLQLNTNGLARTLGVTEWLLGQHAFADADLARWQEQLAPLLRNSSPLKNALRSQRVLAMELAEMQRTDSSDFKKEFGYARFLLGSTIQYSAAEGVKLTTQGIDQADHSLRDLVDWTNQVSIRFGDQISENPIKTYPYTIYTMYLLPRLKKIIGDYIDYQQRIRIGLVALAAERYRLKTQKMPEKPEQLKEFFEPAVAEELLGPHAIVKLFFYPTPFGLVITLYDGNVVPEDPQEWEERVCMNDQGTRILVGFRLYHGKERGLAAAPLPEIPNNKRWDEP
jgi:hypothetical protein